MAATISTTTTLKADFLILVSTLDALIDASDFSGDDCVGLHTAAWTDIQRDLAMRRPPIKESDLTDSSELQHAAHLWVLSRLYDLSDIEADKIESKRWWDRYRKEMRRVQLTITSQQASSAAEAYLVRA